MATLETDPALAAFDTAIQEPQPREEDPALAAFDQATVDAEQEIEPVKPQADPLAAFDQATTAPEVPLEQHPFVFNVLTDPHLNDDHRQDLIETYYEIYQGAYGIDTNAIDSLKLHGRHSFENYSTLGAKLRENRVETGEIEGTAARIRAVESELARREEAGEQVKAGEDVSRLSVIGQRLKAMFTGDTEAGRAAFQADKSDSTLSQTREELVAELEELRGNRYDELKEEARKQAEYFALDSEGLLENAAAVVGSIGGAIADPINLVPVAKPVQGANFATRAATKGVQFAAINAAANPSLQAAAVDANQQEGFEWQQFAADTGLGFLVGVGFEGLGSASKNVLDRFKVDPAKIEGKSLAEAIDTIAEESGEAAGDVAKIIELEVSKPELKSTIDRLRTAAESTEGQKQRGFSERMKRDPNFDEAEIAANPREYYDPQSNVRGEDAVAAMDDAQLEKTFGNMNPDAPSGQNWSTLAGIERLRRAVARGEDTTPIREELAQRGTTLGQAIQQFAQWKTATPEGLLAMVEDAANAGKRKVPDIAKERGLKLAQRRLEAAEALRQAEARHLDEFTDQTAAAYKQARKQAAQAARDFEGFSRDMTPPAFWKSLSTTVKGNLLTSESLLINVLGNALYYPVRKAKGAVATGLDALWGLASRQRTHAEGAAKTRGELVGAAQGIAEGIDAVLHGGTMDDYLKAEVQHGFRPLRAMMQAFAPSEKGIMPTKANGHVAMGDRAKKLLELLIGAPPETMFRLLQMGDKPFRASATRGAVEEIATLRKLGGRDRQKFLFHPDEASRALAMERGDHAVFMKDGAVGKLLRHVDDMIGKIPVIGKPSQFLGTLVVPYRQFPVNFVMEAVDYAMPAVSIGKSLYQASQGNQREATELMAKAITGLTMYSAAGYLYEKGIVTPQIDFRDRKLKQLSYNFAQPPGTINIDGIERLMRGEDPTYREGDKVMGYEKLGVAGIAMHMESQSRWERKKAFAEGNPAVPSPEWWSKALPIQNLGDIPETAGYLAEATPLLGAGNFIGALTDWENKGDRFVQNMFNATSALAVPNLVTAAFKTQYEHIPEMKGQSNAETFANIWNYKTLQLDDGHPTKVGLLGEKVRRTPKGSNPWVYHLANPIDLRSPETNKQYHFIEKLYKQTGDTAVIPGHPSRRFTDPRDGKEYQLDPENYASYQQHVGRARSALIAEVMDTNFRKASSEEVAKAMRMVYSIGLQQGKASFLEDENTDLMKAAREATAVGFTDQ